MTRALSIKTISYAKLQNRYGGKYIARRGDQVVASAGTYDELIEQLRALGVERTELVIAFIPSPDVFYVY